MIIIKFNDRNYRKYDNEEWQFSIDNIIWTPVRFLVDSKEIFIQIKQELRLEKLKRILG